MLILISPAKTLDVQSPVSIKTQTQPELLDRSEPIVKRLRTFSAPKLGALMNVSPAIARENVDRYAAWSRPFTPANARPAVFAFRGDVYQGLDADTLSSRDLTWAQKHLRILSGLYGVLRPLDLMQPYRLEMGTRLTVQRRKDLYAYWGGTITEALNEAIGVSRSRLVVNLASNEYFKSVHADDLDAPVITPAFKEMRNGELKMISFSAKRARGLMARYLIEQRATTADEVSGFAAERYKHHKTKSTDDGPLFTRRGVVAG